MSIERILAEINILNEDKYLQDRVAQLNARYILFNTDESRENFPNYSVRDEEMTLLAFQYLTLGCQLADRELIDEASGALERGAQILEYIYGSKNNEVNFRRYYVLISSLAYYSAFQYSKSFILINKAENETTIAGLLSLFLKRRFSDLQNTINAILVDEEYTSIKRKEGHGGEESERIYEIVIARSLGKIISYLNFGDEKLIKDAKSELETLKEIAELREDVDVWWVIRLILIIIFGIEKSSLWSVLRSHYADLPELGSRFIYSHVFARQTKIHEFFTTQRNALPKVIGNESGVIISMPTSSGKTRIAEVSILDCKIQNENSKILFIAPYRSLAFEIENDLDKIFNPIGVSVSQLYGGSLFSKIDEKLIQDTDVIIATQEKAKALFRSDSEIIKTIKLVVLDEGHMLGADDRLIRNELFMEELRYHIQKNKGKFVVLSAVLPNPKDLSSWLTNSADNIYKSDWRPSEERIGTLEWTGKNVNLNWESADDERDSFNNRFVFAEKQPKKPRERIDKYLPSNLNEAVCATALKLFSFGPVLIFVGRKASVFTMARAYALILGEVEDFNWKNKNNWKAFELACVEFDGVDSEWLAFAKKGILCHNANLPSDVRIPLERLMRTERPRVIIATSTLGQGVNLGVSSVIFSTYYQAGKPLPFSDFWNIAGRAGRAFVDQEGKILVALDTSVRGTFKQRKNNSYKQKQILKYFDKSSIQNAESGLLWMIRAMKVFARDLEGIPFEKLLELIAENSFEKLENSKAFVDGMDLIDDTLLALHQLAYRDNVLDISWVEDFFRKSLAYVQLQNNPDEDIEVDHIISFVQARVKGIIKSVGENILDWQKHIKSGIPLQSDLMLEEVMEEILIVLLEYFEQEDSSVEAKIKLLANIEALINHIPVLQEDYLKSKDLNEIRWLWLSGESMTKIKLLEDAHQIINKHYSFQLPWVLNGIAKKLEAMEYEDDAKLLQELAILSETGLPNLMSVKIYQAGIRSRESAIEISDSFGGDSWDKGIQYYKNMILENAQKLKILLSETTSNWIELFLLYNEKVTKTVNYIEPFAIEGLKHQEELILLPKTINAKEYLVSSDFKVMKPVREVGGLYVSEIIDLDGIFFRNRAVDNLWELIVINPNIYLNIPNNEE